MNAQQLFDAIFNGGIAITIIATVLALGMTFEVGQIVAPLRRWVLVIVMVVLNAVVLPAAAWGITEAFPIDAAAVSGITLAALGAGSAGALKAGMLAKRADLALGVSLVVVLQLVNIVAVPLWASEVVSGASIASRDIVNDLLLLVLLPLAIGLLLRARYPDGSARWQPDIVKISNVALAVALVVGIAVNWETIKSLFGSWELLAVLAVIVVGLLLGFVVGLRDVATRTTTGLVSGMRFGSLGLIVIGTQLGNNPAYLGPAIVFALLDFLLPVVLALEIGKRAPAAPKQ